MREHQPDLGGGLFVKRILRGAGAVLRGGAARAGAFVDAVVVADCFPTAVVERMGLVYVTRKPGDEEGDEDMQRSDGGGVLTVPPIVGTRRDKALCVPVLAMVG